MKSRWLFVLLLAFLATFVRAQGKPVNTSKSECESLMNQALPFAEKMLTKHGEFFPYGQALTATRKVIAVTAYDGKERPPSADLIRSLKQAFTLGARDGRYKATALIYDVRVMLPSSGKKSDAIAVSLNHRDNYSVIVFFPYSIERGKYVSSGEVFAQQGESDIFK